MDSVANPKKSQKPVFEKLLPYALFIFLGYCIADLLILSYRDEMLPSQAPPARPQKASNDGSTSRGALNTIISRNMFSSDGIIPDQLVSAEQKNQPHSEDLPPVASNLPLILVGTIVHSNPAKSIANINVKTKSQTLAYSIGKDIESLAKLEKVERTKIIIRNNNNNRLEFIEMKIDGGKIAFGASKAGGLDGSANPAKSEVAQIAPNKFEIKRSDVLKYTNDMASVLQQAAMQPVRGASGEIEGFKFLSIQPGSIYTQLGFQNGDIIRNVNGEKIDSPAKAMELYNALKNTNSIKMGIGRDGRDQEFDYTVK